MKMISWNVNGLRACLQKGFDDFLQKESPDIIALQETKLQPEQLSYTPEGYHSYFFSAQKKGLTMPFHPVQFIVAASEVHQ